MRTISNETLVTVPMELKNGPRHNGAGFKNPPGGGRETRTFDEEIMLDNRFHTDKTPLEGVL